MIVCLFGFGDYHTHTARSASQQKLQIKSKAQTVLNTKLLQTFRHKQSAWK